MRELNIMHVAVNGNINGNKIATHGRNLLFSVWVLFDHFIPLNGKTPSYLFDIAIQDGILFICVCICTFFAICCYTGSLLRRNKEALRHTFGGSPLE